MGIQSVETMGLDLDLDFEFILLLAAIVVSAHTRFYELPWPRG